jgi:ubiquinone/menaquinone biosynthesis C-methylase UbiE
MERTVPVEDFDAAAATWDDAGHVQRAEAVARAVRAQIPVHSGMSVLEFGCGTGLLGLALWPHIARLTLADPSPGMIEVVRAKIARLDTDGVEPLLVDGDKPRFPARYDLIATLMTLHHIPDVDGTIDLLARHLAPEGYLALIDLDSEDGSFHGPDVDVHHGFARTAIRKRLEACGLKNLRDSTPYAMRKHVNGSEREYPLFLITAQA